MTLCILHVYRRSAVWEGKKKRVICVIYSIFIYNVQIARLLSPFFSLSLSFFSVGLFFFFFVSHCISFELAYWSQREKRTSSLGGRSAPSAQTGPRATSHQTQSYIFLLGYFDLFSFLPDESKKKIKILGNEKEKLFKKKKNKFFSVTHFALKNTKICFFLFFFFFFLNFSIV